MNGTPDLRPPTYTMSGPVVCDACGEEFTTGHVRIEDARVVGALCVRCDLKRTVTTARPSA